MVYSEEAKEQFYQNLSSVINSVLKSDKLLLLRGSLPLLKDPVITELATKYRKSPAQIALRFLVQQNITVIPKSVTPARVEENIKVFDFELTSEEMEKLFSLNKNFRNYKEEIALDHKYYPFHEEF